MMRPLHPVLALLAMVLALSLPDAGQAQTQFNDYPTEARAEYVVTCMASNGQNQEQLRRCSCAIDMIAEILPYADYVAAETVLRMRQTGGERGAMFRGMPKTRDIMAELRRAEAEAEMLCF